MPNQSAPIAWKGFREKDPFAAQLISNIRLSDEEIASLMAALEGSKTTEEATVKAWMKDHAALIESLDTRFCAGIERTHSNSSMILFTSTGCKRPYTFSPIITTGANPQAPTQRRQSKEYLPSGSCFANFDAQYPFELFQ